MQRSMIDIETLGVNPGCAILSIGAVKFDEDGLGDEFYEEIDLHSCDEVGLGYNPGTVKWWFSQDPDLLRGLGEGIPLKDALVNLNVFLRDAEQVWANSPSMDCSILEEAYERVGLEEPWEYYEERCYRTLFNESNHNGDVDMDENIQMHNALDDAKYQALVASEILQDL